VSFPPIGSTSGGNISGGIVAQGHCELGGSAVIDAYCPQFDPTTKVLTNPAISGGLYLDMHAV
jgi:hypothetical protein